MRKDQKKLEATKVIKQFEREKTIMLERKNLVLDRQKTMLNERIEKIKYERTQTMKEKGRK